MTSGAPISRLPSSKGCRDVTPTDQADQEYITYVSPEVEFFAYHLPRSMMGEGLSIVRVAKGHNSGKAEYVTITDGERSAIYVPVAEKDLLEVPGLAIAPDRYTEAGWYTQANVVTLNQI
jgi:hypothetical protein